MSDQPTKIRKVRSKGKVAVLVSPGYGAGFFTWGAPIEAIFHPTLVRLIQRKKYEQAIEFVNETWPGEFYGGGIVQLRVEWIPEGSKFIIEEYDGAESIQLLENLSWLEA